MGGIFLKQLQRLLTSSGARRCDSEHSQWLLTMHRTKSLRLSSEPVLCTEAVSWRAIMQLLKPCMHCLFADADNGGRLMDFVMKNKRTLHVHVVSTSGSNKHSGSKVAAIAVGAAKQR
jgi:hypothetical protein